MPDNLNYPEIYNINQQKLLRAKKIAKEISKFTVPHSVWASISTHFFDPEMGIDYGFNYNQFDLFNEWLTKNFVKEGKYFIFKGTFDNEPIEIKVIGVFEECY